MLAYLNRPVYTNRPLMHRSKSPPKVLNPKIDFKLFAFFL
uniref:Uncharacterized protein n=1 Tax=Rhizophora mucronata TaxID=61149 RepID=A0A2P2R3Q2_RHIMU